MHARRIVPRQPYPAPQLSASAAALTRQPCGQFVGHIGELAELKQKLLVNQDCQGRSVVGLGGTGRTQVALQFACSVKQMRPEYSIFWMSALSIEIPPAAGGEEDVKELVQQLLSSSRAGRWLLVVDDAATPISTV
jgi:hypothetical protein